MKHWSCLRILFWFESALPGMAMVISANGRALIDRIAWPWWSGVRGVPYELIISPDGKKVAFFVAGNCCIHTNIVKLKSCDLTVLQRLLSL